MKRLFIFIAGLLIVLNARAQESDLTIRKIMQDPKHWIGSSPNNPFWSEDSKTLYFNWNPEANSGDSLYKITLHSLQPVKVLPAERKTLVSSGVYSKDFQRKLCLKHDDIYWLDIPRNQLNQVTNTVCKEQDPAFTRDINRITYTNDYNLYSLNLNSGQLIQHTDFKKLHAKKKNESSESEEWLKGNEQSLIRTLEQRKNLKEEKEKTEKPHLPKRPKTYYLEDRVVHYLQLSPDEKFVTFVLQKGKGAKHTYVPNYITESGFTEEIKSRPKVGFDDLEQDLGIYNIEKDTIYFAITSNLPGIDKIPEFRKDYNTKEAAKKRCVLAYSPQWSDDGKHALVVFKSFDNKDRWLTLLDASTGQVNVLDHQHDEAWISGPGIGWLSSPGYLGWMPDQRHIWFQSEESGYSHIYTIDVVSREKKALTSGNFEVHHPKMSRDKKRWYFNANMTHPGDYQFYTMPVHGGKIEKLTTMTGKNMTYLSPDEKKIAFLYSASNKPWELYIMDNLVYTKKQSVQQITFSTKKEFDSYPWREPEIISFKARDGVKVYARLYRPAEPKENGPAVIFVHGAGYLQNAHRWWSSYFREYMFHNLLADKGYTVLDIDYRGSAGYGRDFRTGIYRTMGEKDLTDQLDGVRYLVDHHSVNPKKIGIYGGSYGGFITLMAMFTQPETFAAGAALRSVTDWAHYNHPYTANILNTPVEDSLSYRKSSPIYYAEGLKGALLMCHGMVDTNVHFQDIVRLTQRLIELGKENWELAVYPMEDHAFTEPSSWADEYRRVLKLFEENLR